MPDELTPRALRLRLNTLEEEYKGKAHLFPPEEQVYIRYVFEEAMPTPKHVAYLESLLFVIEATL